MENVTEVESVCYHCGEPTEGAEIWKDDKQFCCYGCKTVFELLDQNDLCDYYDLENTPGNQLKHFFKEKYAFLDNEEITQLLLDFNSEEFQKITFHIPSIHCSSCIWLLENIHRFDDGIIRSQINFSKKRLTVDLNPQKTTIRKTVDLLCQLGYEPNISLEGNSEKVKNNSKETFVKLGVSGFIFGNIMLLSFPEYLGLESDSVYKDYFAYINLAFSLPLIFYCAQEFYTSAIGALRKKILNIDLPITIGIATLFFRSIFDIISNSGPGYLDSLAGLIFFLLIGRWFQSKTYEGLSFDRNFKSYFPLAVNKVIEQKLKSILVSDIQIDDVLEIRNEEIIPCDSILLSTNSYIDYSFVTGESQPLEVERKTTLYAGGRVKGPSIKIRAIKKVSQGYLTDLWNNPVFDKTQDQEEASIIDKVSQYFTPIVLLIAFVSGAYWAVIDSSKLLFVVSSVLIIACPCALALATPFTLGTVLNFLGSKGVYLKNTSILERFWKIQHLVFDKTGTLTTGRDNLISFEGESLSNKELGMIKSLVKNSTHPISQQISAHLSDVETFKIDEFIEVKGKGIQASISGSVVRLGNASFLGIENETISGAQAFVSINQEYKGYFVIKNQYRKSLAQCIQHLNEYKFTILSGDNSLEELNLKTIFPENTEFLFEQSPKSKLEYVEHISRNEKVMMLGDGLNDSGALQASNIGVSVAENISSFTPASDIIILGNKVSQLHQVFSLVKTAKSIIIAGFILSFAYNLVGLSLAVAGYITPVFAAILMPVSSISVVIFSTLATRTLGNRIFRTWK
ncbi:heavy metal translocating P-type ATPase [Reichenbachiella versicolor]|uniref:heavy metal translocating P-type ATPase n=1 Tax=Reichenbachiella versicolor TaxID=1821036 RepID=UPI000D6E8D3C|nr:heavy metal translocating P-type ATPase metal-binding domain-containing protein [Reichenbachiella versicolor]